MGSEDEFQDAMFGEYRDCESLEADDQRMDDLERALRAIIARVKGVWDSPDLIHYGPLANTNEDVLRIAESALE